MFRSLCLVFLGCALSVAEPVPHAAADNSAPAEFSTEEIATALEHLLAERESPAAFETAVTAARRHGIVPQAILEARFLFHVDRHEDAEIASLLPEFLAQDANFKLEDSEIFATHEDWSAVVEYVRAIEALQRGDAAAFKKHITEAFWLSPRQGAVFAPQIERLRMQREMERVTLDFSRQFRPLGGGQPVALVAADSDVKGVVLHFWSPWSRECELTLEDFKATASELRQHGIAVLSVLPETTPEAVNDGRSMLNPAGEKSIPGGPWLLDDGGAPLARELRIFTLPSMVLFSSDGKVLFNGHPAEDAFWAALEALEPGIHRPQAVDDHIHE